ncbi:hypothetical protein CF15_06280 [Pyrodictium occultum]|uniref:DUF72 domain-containing protein n=1 Tax=Pyrodictium occultum TaxID=2309 RepID=A0A0V8RWE3_PYROC|nr:DUF72 domain-containing protein [Pyrodictium occultum]KSW12344.1 hypothetical protein CF15_06280 [Pyrodictium occultum]
MAPAAVFVGCCGFPFSRKKYYELFSTVELQQTFYDLPERSLAEKWRREAPSSFIFNMKAWQVITHPPTSPTWRRMRRRPQGRLENYGYLRPTPENLEAWRKSVEIAETLRARVMVLQTPPSFGYSGENERNAREFFSRALEAVGDAMLVGWEPRGSWLENYDAIKDIVCGRPGLIHVVDILRRPPVVCEGQELLYFRLHGLGGREVNYRYKYRDEDLARLASILASILEEYDSVREVYVMFNNIYMGEDAQRFREIAAGMGLRVI